MMQRPWRGTAYWLAYHDLLNLLSYRIQDHVPRDSTTQNGPGPPNSISNEEDDLELDLTKAFSQVIFPSLRQL